MLWRVSLCLYGMGLVEAGSAFLRLRAQSADGGDSTENTTTIASTTRAPTTTTAVPDTDPATPPRAMVIRGATGDNAEIVNGNYKSGDIVHGHPSWVKVTDTEVRLIFVTNASGGAWYVKPAAHDGGLLQGVCKGQCLPSDVQSWLVTKDGAWTPEVVSVGSLDESFSSDWLAPTLTVLAVLMAVAGAAAGAGSLQKGLEFCSMSGTWFNEAERYSVTAATPTVLPSVLVSLLQIAFPVPIPGGDLQFSLQPTRAPHVRVEFRKAFNERGSLIWQSDEGATIRRLSRDSAEFTPQGPPGLESRLLRRVPDNSRSRMLPATWLLLACVWFRPPVAMSMAALFVALGLLQLAVSFAASHTGVRCSLPGTQHVWVFCAVAAAMPLLCLVAFDFFSHTLSGSITAVALLSLHAVSLMGPRLLVARPHPVSAACLAGWLVAAVALVFFIVGALLFLDVAWAFDRSKATVALACLGSWMAVPMQVGGQPTQTVSASLAATTDAEAGAQTEGIAEESLSSSEHIAEVGLRSGRKAGSTLSTGSASTMSLLSAASSADSSLKTWQSVHRMPSHLSELSASSPRATLHAAQSCPSQGLYDTTIPSRQGSAASVTSTRSRASSRSGRSRAHGAGTERVSSEASGRTMRPEEAMTASGGVPAAPSNKEDLLLAMLQVPESHAPLSARARSRASSGRAGDQESQERGALPRRSHSRTRSPRASLPPHAPQPTAPVQSLRPLQNIPAASSEAMFDSLPMKQKRGHANKAHKSAPSSEGPVTDITILPKHGSERRVSSASPPVSATAPRGLERSRSSGPSRSMSSSSVTSSLQSQPHRSLSERPKIRAAPGDRFMFVNRTGHEYDHRCQEYEIVTVVRVTAVTVGVKVQWQNGFVQHVRMTDLCDMPSLTAAGGLPGLEDIPDMPIESDRSLRRVQASRSPSRRRKEIRRMPDMPSLEGGFTDF